MVKVIKRDCTEVDFQKEKISNAILKAMKNGSGIVRPKIAEDIANEIYEKHKDENDVDIYTIEAEVFDKLISKKQRLTARSYEGYRSIRKFQREYENTIDKDIVELINGDSDYWKNENANKNPVLNTTIRDYMAGIESEDISRMCAFLLYELQVQLHQMKSYQLHSLQPGLESQDSGQSG